MVDDFVASLSRRYVAAGVLITDRANRILLVQPTFKPSWEIPGGIAEAEESPAAAAERECREELGVHVLIGRLLVVEHETRAGRGDSLKFVYAGHLPGDAKIRLPEAELKSCRYVSPEDLTDYEADALARRVRAALAARADSSVAELVNSRRRPAG